MTPAEQIRAALDEALVALDALEAERANRARNDAVQAALDADKVWLTRDEAERFRAWVEGSTKGFAAELYALLDERLGDRPTSIRAMIDGENPPLKKGGTMTTATSDPLVDTLDLGIQLEELRRGEGDQDAHFDRIVDLLWQFDPSAMPDKTRLQLRMMGLEEAFDQYLADHNATLPVNYGGPVRWVIAPII